VVVFRWSFLLETRLQSESWYFWWPAGVSGSKVV